MGIRRWLLMASALVALFLIGCKATEMVIVNDLGEDAVVTIQGPGHIKPNPPTLPVANAGRGIFKIETPESKLPADYVWQAAGRTGTVVVSKDSPEQQVLNLSTGQKVPGQVIGPGGGGGRSPSVDVKVR